MKTTDSPDCLRHEIELIRQVLEILARQKKERTISVTAAEDNNACRALLTTVLDSLQRKDGHGE